MNLYFQKFVILVDLKKSQKGKKGDFLYSNLYLISEKQGVGSSILPLATRFFNYFSNK